MDIKITYTYTWCIRHTYWMRALMFFIGDRKLSQMTHKDFEPLARNATKYMKQFMGHIATKQLTGFCEDNDQLSETCDNDIRTAVEQVACYLTKPTKRSGTPAPFDIAEMSLDKAFITYGAEAVLQYIYDWAYDEQDRMDDEIPSRDSKDWDDDRYCEMGQIANWLEGEIEPYEAN